MFVFRSGSGGVRNDSSGSNRWLLDLNRDLDLTCRRLDDN